MGYRPTGRVQSDYYVRARHYSSLASQWTTIDLLWPELEPHVYSGAGPATALDPMGLTATSTGCSCCCPTGIKIRNWKPLNRWRKHDVYGHSFDVHWGYSYHPVGPNKPSGHCSLQWWERTNMHRSPNELPDHWCDQYDYQHGSPLFKPWDHRERPRKGAPRHPPVLTDVPNLGLADYLRDPLVRRQLCFRIAIWKSPGCNCPRAAMKATAIQVLVGSYGAGKCRKFETPFDNIGYCRFP